MAEKAAEQESEVDAFLSAQQKEYGEWVAIAPISHDGAPAYRVGDPVPASNVKKHKYDTAGLVAKRDSKAAQAATGSEG